MYKVVILSNGKHVIYEPKEDGNWHFPCIIDTNKSPKGPFIYFDPLTVFCEDDTIKPIMRNHIFTGYKPSESIIEAFEEFKKRYHDALNKIEDGNKQTTKINNTVH